MAEWWIERGIGELRAALIDDGRIVAARIEPDDHGVRVGTITRARLTDAGTVTLVSGEQATLAARAGASVGAALTVEIVREALPEPGRIKLARAIVADAPPCAGVNLSERIGVARLLHAHDADLLETAGWSEVLSEAMHGEIAFAGGALRLSPTPAMTLFDVDGPADTALDALAVRAAGAVARAIVRHDIGGSIGIDFPTITGKAARRAVADAIDTLLPPPFERTALNGFGFLQIVRPRPRASLPELLRADPVAATTRAALRTIERTPPSAPNRYRLAPTVMACLDAHPHWLAELVRRTGRVPIFDR